MPIVTNGLVGYWNAQQGISGTTWNNIAPGTTGKYNGTLNGGVVKNTDNVSLDGIDDYVGIGAIQASDKGTAFEVEMYLSAPFNGTGGSFGIFMPFSSMTTGDSTCINFNVNGTSVGMSDDTKSFTYTAPKNTLIKVNYSVNVTTRQETMYINDAQVAQETDPYAVDHLNGVLFGRLSTADSNFSFKGLIYSIKIYNRILTSAERTQNTGIGTAVGLDAGGTTYTGSGAAQGTSSLTSAEKLTLKATGTLQGISNVSSSEKSILAARGTAQGYSSLSSGESLIQQQGTTYSGSGTVQGSSNLSSNENYRYKASGTIQSLSSLSSQEIERYAASGTAQGSSSLSSGETLLSNAPKTYSESGVITGSSTLTARELIAFLEKGTVIGYASLSAIESDGSIWKRSVIKTVPMHDEVKPTINNWKEPNKPVSLFH